MHFVNLCLAKFIIVNIRIWLDMAESGGNDSLGDNSGITGTPNDAATPGHEANDP